jgi:hypothetical protein
MSANMAHTSLDVQIKLGLLSQKDKRLIIEKVDTNIK